MARTKEKATKETEKEIDQQDSQNTAADRTTGMVRKAILASIGVYGMAYDEAVEQFEDARERFSDVRGRFDSARDRQADFIQDLRKNPTETFERLVERGEEVEEDALGIVETARDRMEETRTRFEENRERWTKLIIFPGFAGQNRLSDLEAEVKALKKKITAIEKKSSTSSKSRKSTARKTTKAAA